VNFYGVVRRKLPEFAEMTQNNPITPFKVIEGHRFWYQSKAHIRFPISDYYWLTSYLAPFPRYSSR